MSEGKTSSGLVDLVGNTLLVSGESDLHTTEVIGNLSVTGNLTVTGTVFGDASSLQGHTWASPDPIGSTTPSSATFTTLNATTVTAPNNNASTLLTKTWASPDPIGTTTPSSATFTTLNATTFTAANNNASTLLTKTWASPDPIGSTTPSSATFTTLDTTTVTVGVNVLDSTASTSRIRTAATAGLDFDAQGPSKSIRLLTNSTERVLIQDAATTIDNNLITLSTLSALAASFGGPTFDITAGATTIGGDSLLISATTLTITSPISFTHIDATSLTLTGLLTGTSATFSGPTFNVTAGTSALTLTSLTIAADNLYQTGASTLTGPVTINGATSLTTGDFSVNTPNITMTGGEVSITSSNALDLNSTTITTITAATTIVNGDFAFTAGVFRTLPATTDFQINSASIELAASSSLTLSTSSLLSPIEILGAGTLTARGTIVDISSTVGPLDLAATTDISIDSLLATNIGAGVSLNLTSLGSTTISSTGALTLGGTVVTIGSSAEMSLDCLGSLNLNSALVMTISASAALVINAGGDLSLNSLALATISSTLLLTVSSGAAVEISAGTDVGLNSTLAINLTALAGIAITATLGIGITAGAVLAIDAGLALTMNAGAAMTIYATLDISITTLAAMTLETTLILEMISAAEISIDAGLAFTVVAGADSSISAGIFGIQLEGFSGSLNISPTNVFLSANLLRNLVLTAGNAVEIHAQTDLSITVLGNVNVSAGAIITQTNSSDPVLTILQLTRDNTVISTAGDTSVVLGWKTTTLNSAYQTFTYVSSSSTSNYFSEGITGYAPALSFTSSAITIGGSIYTLALTPSQLTLSNTLTASQTIMTTLAPLAVSSILTSSFGRTETSLNSGQMKFNYIGAASPSNNLSFNLYGQTSALQINSTTVTIGTPADHKDLFVYGSVSWSGASGDSSQLEGATWEAPLAIGTTTPNIGNFTTITSSAPIGTAPLTVVSTTVVPNLNVSQLLGATWAAPLAIGNTTPSTGAFTSLTTTAPITVTNPLTTSGYNLNLMSPSLALGSFTGLLVGESNTTANALSLYFKAPSSGPNFGIIGMVGYDNFKFNSAEVDITSATINLTGIVSILTASGGTPMIVDVQSTASNKIAVFQNSTLAPGNGTQFFIGRSSTIGQDSGLTTPSP